MTITAWYMDSDENEDQRSPHRREGQSDVSFEELEKLVKPITVLFLL
jgi:hypothetical protein